MTVTPVGTHCILELFGCSPDLLNCESFVRDTIAQSSREGMSTLLQLSSHKFEPQGVTALALLAESHISIHTWPENGYAAVDVFTCGDTANPRLACDYLARSFGAAKSSLKVLPRGFAHAGAELASKPNLSQEAQLCPVAN